MRGGDAGIDCAPASTTIDTLEDSTSGIKPVKEHHIDDARIARINCQRNGYPIEAKAIVDYSPTLTAITAFVRAAFAPCIDDIRINGINRQHPNVWGVSCTHVEYAPAAPAISALEYIAGGTARVNCIRVNRINRQGPYYC